jgi:phospholipase/carboxylesterase
MLSESLLIKHLARPPDAPHGARAPLLMLLHGVGSNEEDLFNLAPQLDPRFYVLSLRGHYEIAPNQFGWYERAFTPMGHEPNVEQAESSRRNLAEFIVQAVEHYEADPDLVFLMGFSQGASLCLASLLTEPRNIKGVVSIAGRLLAALFKPGSPMGGKLADAPDLAKRALFLGHGISDQTTPIEMARGAEKILSRAPLEMTYREYEMGHEIGERCLREMDVWLRTQLGGTGSLGR